MTAETWLRIAYVGNLLLLGPALLTLARPGGAAGVFGTGVPETPPLRMLAFSFWTGVAVCSALGLWRPRLLAGVLILQVVYKAVWLVAFALPAWRRGGGSAVPTVPAAVFAFMVAGWSLLLVLAWRAA